MVWSDPASPTADARIGKYRLLRRIAAGGMAEVFLATDDGKALWAVKLILPHLADQPEFIGLFLDEARLASLLNHPNVARVRDMGMENGRLFLAMEYARGQPLSALLTKLKEKQVSLTPVQAAAILAQAAAGLNAAHDAKARDGSSLELVHRDVSPQNLLLTEDGLVKVVDFGIAKARNKLVVTQVNTTRGKPWYMSPEQMRGEQLDRRADIFSLGAVLFELLLGSRLFEGDVDQVMFKALNEPLPSIKALKPETPDELAEIIRRACARRPEERFETAWEMEQELLAFASGQGGAGDLGALVRDNFPRMPASVDEIVGPPAPAGANSARPPTRSGPSRPISRPPTASSKEKAVLPPSGPPVKMRRPGTGAAKMPTVGEAPPDEEKTPATPSAELGTEPPAAQAPEAPAAPPAAPAAPPVAAPAPTATGEQTAVDDVQRVPAQIPKRGEQRSRGGNRTQIVVGAVVAVLFAAAGGGLAYHFAMKGEEKPAQPAPPAKPQGSLLPPDATAAAPGPTQPAAPKGETAAAPGPAQPTVAPQPRAEEPVPSALPANLGFIRVSCSYECNYRLDGKDTGKYGNHATLDAAPGAHKVEVTYVPPDQNTVTTSVTTHVKAGQFEALHFGPRGALKDRSGMTIVPSAYRATMLPTCGSDECRIKVLRAALAMTDAQNPEAHKRLGELLATGENADRSAAAFHLMNYVWLARQRDSRHRLPKDADEVLNRVKQLSEGELKYLPPAQ